MTLFAVGLGDGNASQRTGLDAPSAECRNGRGFLSIAAPETAVHTGGVAPPVGRHLAYRQEAGGLGADQLVLEDAHFVPSSLCDSLRDT